MGKKLTQNQFISRCSVIFNNKYDYSKTIYTNFKNKVTITCPTHGDFKQLAQNHICGRGCFKCARTLVSSLNKNKVEDFIKKCNEVHGYMYNYSLVKYVNNNTPVKVICPFHGEFEQLPRIHIKSGCRLCKGGFTKSSWIEKCRKNKHSFIYVIKCFNNDKSETFIKIGITSRSLKERFPVNKTLPYNYSIIAFFEDTPERIWELEKEIHFSLRKDYQYIPKIKFHGMYECFNEYVMEVAYKYIYDTRD